MTIRSGISRSFLSCLRQGGQLFLLACLHAWASIPTQAAPRLAAGLDPEKSVVRLELQGSAAVQYEIEASTDLQAWIPVASGPAIDGMLINEQPLSTEHRFFRAREAVLSTNGNTLPTTVTPLADTNLSVAFLVTSDGGTNILYSPDGTQFRLTFPPMAFLDAEVITMTLVTNVGGLPFSQGMLGAVSLESEGLALWGAGTLEISLPPGLDLRKIVSFGAQKNGFSFGYTPDRVSTQRVVIPVAEFGLYGSALAADEDFRSPAASDAFRARSRPDFRAQTAECFPDRAADAQFWDEHIARLTEDFFSRVAQALIQARRGQSAPDAGDTFDSRLAEEQADLDICSHVSQIITPLRNEAAGNCALARVLMQRLSLIRSQREALGLSGLSTCPNTLDTVTACDRLRICLKEVKECCERGTKGPAQIQAIQEIAFLQRLFGVAGCLSAAEIDQAIDTCAAGRWTGVLTLKIDGRESHETQPRPGDSVTELETEKQEFRGHVVDSIEFASSQGTNATLTVEGQAVQTIDRTRIGVYGGVCGGTFTHEYTGNFARAPATYSVLVTMNPGQAPTVIITPTPGPNPTLPGRKTFYNYRQTGFRDGDGNCALGTNSETEREDWIGTATGAVFGKPATFQDNQLTGSADLDRFQMRLPGTGTFEWRLVRHPDRE